MVKPLPDAIIKLYEATGGEVYFNGVRIIADYKKLKVHAELMKAFKEAKKNLSESELEQWQTKLIHP